MLSTGQLIDQLWGDEPPPAARNSLQSHVARLRAVVDGEVIVTRPPGYALDLSKAAIDATRFEQAVGAARALVVEDPRETVALLLDGLAEWRGEAHAEFAEDLARFEAVRLRNLRVEAYRLLADAQRGSGDGRAAVDTLLRLVQDAPLREDVVLAAGRARGEVDRSMEALALLRTYREGLGEGLGLDPGSEVGLLEQHLLRGEVADLRGPRWPATAPRPGSVQMPVFEAQQRKPTSPPSVPTITVGRDHDLQRLDEALRRSRLVTLVGPGGVGQTRLAAVAAHVRAQEGHRVAWVDLATVTTAHDLYPLIAEALAVAVPDREQPTAAATALARFDGTVVLDNCEHLAAEIAKLTTLVLGKDGPGQLLATSRERLDVPGEQVTLIGPLPVPEPEVATENDAVIQLFQDRAMDGGALPVTAAEAARVAAAVDGLPLGVELAAARAASLPIEEMLARLDQHLDILAESPRRHGERHRTLSNVIAWSYELLGERDRTVFRRLAAFASSFQLEDAEQVCSDSDLAPSEVVDAVVRLVEASMVARVGTGHYRLLGPLRLFAAGQLDRDPDGEVTWRRHRTLVLDLAQRADEELTGPGEAVTIAALEAALPDLRAVYSRAVSEGDLATVARLAGRLHRYAYAQARGDLLAWGGIVADQEVDDLTEGERLRAIAASVPAATWSNDAEEGRRRSRLYADHLDDDEVDPGVGLTLAETLADLHLSRGDLEGAVAAYERGVCFASRVGHRGLLSYMTSGLSIAKPSTVIVATPKDWLARQPSSSEAAVFGRPPRSRPTRSASHLPMTTPMAPYRPSPRIARTADVALRGRHGDPLEAFPALSVGAAHLAGRGCGWHGADHPAQPGGAARADRSRY